MIPVVDLVGAPDIDAPALTAAIERMGFVAVRNHGVPLDQIESMRELLVELFELEDDTKREYAITRTNYRGFIPLGFFTPNRDDPGAPAPDVYEGFKLHWEVDASSPLRKESPIYGPNRWVPGVERMRETVLDYWASCERLASTLLEAFEHALGLCPGELLSRCDRPVTNMTLLHYPPTDPGEDRFGIHPHKDTNVLTILSPDPVGGLFVRSGAGDWIEAVCPDDALLINVGDMMEVWSGGRYPSTPHKVVNVTGAERYGFPWFLVPSHDEVIEPVVPPIDGFVRIDPVHVGEWSLEVWRTNWPDAAPSDSVTHLGTLDFD